MSTFIETREMVEDNCGVQLRVKDDGFEESISIAMRMRRGIRQYDVATAILMEPSAEGMPMQPLLTLQKSTIQDLFNQLWQLGFRPKDGTGNSGHIESLKYHLEDMRKLVFKEPT